MVRKRARFTSIKTAVKELSYAHMIPHPWNVQILCKLTCILTGISYHLTSDYYIYVPLRLVLCVRNIEGKEKEDGERWMNEDTQRMMACIAKHCLPSITCTVL